VKIALLHYTCPPVVGGVEIVLGQHARLFADAGHEVRVLAGRGEPFDRRVPVRILPRLNSRNPEVLEIKTFLDQGTCPIEFNRMCSEIREELLEEMIGVDLLIAHNVASLHKNLPLTAALHDAYRVSGFPHLILWHHDLAWTTMRYRSELYPGYPWDLLRSRWKGAQHVTVSALRREELVDLLGLPENSIRIIPNGLDLSSFYKFEDQTIHLVEKLKLASADPLLLLPARLTPRKNIELALQVVKELRSDYPRTMLLVTGPVGPHNPDNLAYQRKLLALRDRLGLRGAAHFLVETTSGFVPDPVIADFYRLADALFFPTKEEGFGIPLLEAALSSMPVFCTDLPVLRELGGTDVCYFNADETPQNIARLVHSHLEGEATSRLSRRVRHSFNWESIYTSYLAPLIKEAVP
jgi:glycosyltransferase involved in cell wall biosynthesis